MNRVNNLPTRLHHNAYVTADMEATRPFLRGFDRTSAGCHVVRSRRALRERTDLLPLLSGLADDSALAFFQFANAEDQALFGPKMPASPFHHIALNCDAQTQDRVKKRLERAGFQEPNLYVLQHGYCKSLYAADPNGMILELTVDNPEAAKGADRRRATAHGDLQRWLAGDYSSNNTFRAAVHQHV